MKKTIAVWLVAFGGAILAAEVYKRCTTPKQKSKWEGFANTHHGEAGTVMAAIGIGLMLHDIDDCKKWFR